jgi:hypothetical protein
LEIAMKNFFGISALALAAAIMPATLLAQSATDAPPTASSAMEAPSASTTFTMNAEQKAQYETWPSDVKAKYDAGSAAEQEYAWSLDADQMKGWNLLSQAQRNQIVKLSADERTKVWAQIKSQMGGSSAAGTNALAQADMAAAAPAGADMASGATDQGTAMASADNSATPPPALDGTQKKYPVCTKKIQDSCRNRGGV